MKRGQLLVMKSVKRDTHRAIKLICIICLSMTVGALIVAWNSPAVAYEPSIYTATPLIVWLVLFVNLVCGIGIVVHQVSSERHTKDNLWILGLGLVLLSYAIILSLWIIRGYALWGDGDPFWHLGEVYNLISSGYINTVYPITHILLAQISHICGLSPVVFHNILPVIFGVFHVAFMYLLAKSILTNKGQIILTILVSTTFMLTTSYLQLTPNRLANLALPLALFILIKSLSSGTIQWKLLLIIMVFLFPTFHLAPAFLILLMLLAIWLMSVLPWISGRKFSKHTLGFNFTATALLVIWTIFWLAPHPQWVYLFTDAEGIRVTPPFAERSLYDSLYEYLFRWIPFYLANHGGILICIIFMLASIPILLKKIRLQPGLGKLVSLYGTIAACLFVIVVNIFTKLVFNNPLARFQPYILIVGTLFVGFVLYELLERARQTHTHLTRIVPPIVIVFLVALFLFGTVVLYESPFRFNNNYQITRTEIKGMDWFLHKKDVTMPIAGILIPPGQFAEILLTSEERRNRPHIHTYRGMIRTDLRLPSHLGYDKKSNIGKLYAQETYLVLRARDRMLHQGPHHPELRGLTFLPQDFERLKEDSSLDHIYSNGGLDVYFINSLK
ncbi:MAG: hypothetical protein DDT40_01051 [candidate division WS2 bacterium]|nr:hypothetical protein [Candidatus Psychracetigena formicireducens]